MLNNMKKDLDSKLVFENSYGVQIRYANTKSSTWPGWSETAGLGKKGYWVGSFEEHRYIGNSKEDMEREKERLSC